MNTLPNVFGWSIDDNVLRKFYYDNWESKDFSECWNALWKEILSKFSLIFNQKPKIKLTCLIYSPDKMSRIFESEIQMASKNSLFRYNWKLIDENSNVSTKGYKSYEDVITCFNSMCHFYHDMDRRGCMTIAEIELVYHPTVSRNLLDIYRERNKNLEIIDRSIDAGKQAMNCLEFPDFIENSNISTECNIDTNSNLYN